MLDGGAALDDQLADGDAGRAYHVAGATVEAVVQVFFDAGVFQIEFAVFDSAQQAQSAARGLRLKRRLLVCGADRQAAPAADAVGQRIVVGQVGSESLLAGNGFEHKLSVRVWEWLLFKQAGYCHSKTRKYVVASKHVGFTKLAYVRYRAISVHGLSLRVSDPH